MLHHDARIVGVVSSPAGFGVGHLNQYTREVVVAEISDIKKQ